MLDSDTLKFAVPAVIAVVGWFAGHEFSVYRDRQNKRRDLRIQFLLDAYRRLESGAHRQTMTDDQKLAVESAVADIQLLGTPEQVAATASYVRRHAADSGAEIDEVLRLLRSDLRNEVGLPGRVENALIFRFDQEP